MGDFPYMDWLTREYKKRAETSGDWTDYLKVRSSDRLPLVSPQIKNKIKIFKISKHPGIWTNGSLKLCCNRALCHLF